MFLKYFPGHNYMGLNCSEGRNWNGVSRGTFKRPKNVKMQVILDKESSKVYLKITSIYHTLQITSKVTAW